MARNPFNQLYVGDRVSPDEFVAIFSTELVEPAMALFEQGNVILAGVQGTGKSMLLKLFSPRIRAAYLEVGVQFPVPDSCPRFIAASINVNTAGCNQFGRRRPPQGDYQQELMFADFLNYYICIDLLRNIDWISEHKATSETLGLRWDRQSRDKFAMSVASDPVWRGFLRNADGMDGLIGRMNERIQEYRNYLSSPGRELDPVVSQTKTPPGDAMEVIVERLRSMSLVPSDLEFYALVDQYEELGTITDPTSRKADYRSVVNGMMNRREAQISYRVGTRGYGWRNHTNIFGTDARIEQDRDFKLVDLDATLKRYEDPATNIFPAFARSVFKRRVAHYGSDSKDAPAELHEFVGKSQSATQKAKSLAGSEPRSYLSLNPDWPEEVQETLYSLAEEDPLDAKLGEIWIRQKGPALRDNIAARPWRRKQYWVKERATLALLRIAGARKQRVMYAGEDDVIGLCGNNILTFLSLCQYIWKNAVQARTRRKDAGTFPVSTVIQTIAVFECGIWWLDRIPGEYGRGEDRHLFVQSLGQMFNNWLSRDLAMSNPGHSGFSLTLEDLASNPDVRDLIDETVDFGNLTRREHTTKSSDRKRRLKFYLNPIYCPIYRLPAGQIKEPSYVTAAQVREWLRSATVSGFDQTETPQTRRSKAAKSRSTSLPLLDALDKDK